MNLELRGVVISDLTAAEVEEVRRQLAIPIPDEEIDAEVAERERRAAEEADVLDDQLPEIVSLKDAVSLVPHSKSTLYRVATAGGEDSPFFKQAGRWVTTRADLLAWVRAGSKGTRPAGSPDPMPRRCHSAGDVLAAIEGREGR